MSDYKISLGVPDTHWYDVTVDTLVDPETRSALQGDFPELYSGMPKTETAQEKPIEASGFAARPAYGRASSKVAKYQRGVSNTPIATGALATASKSKALGFDTTESRYGRQLLEATNRVMRSNNPAILQRNQMLSQRGISINPTVTVEQGADVPAPTPPASPKEVL
jgi:hypothetical protein